MLAILEFEQAGIEEAQHAAFVLIAGGLGERLGYNGIKVALPLETSTGTCFLQHYIESILALQDASYRKTEGNHKRDLPFAIMTSDDTCTHVVTLGVKFLFWDEAFTSDPHKAVACLEDNDARLALDPKNKYRIQTKPHGHGDVHSLLYSSGLLKKWYVHHLAAAQNTR
ncbi:UDP-sugar pyrophosphorylase-like protein [Drosera capensis]